MAMPRLRRRHVVDHLAVDLQRRREVISSSPAIMRSSVDLPQPDGPTKTMNSPDLMSRSMPCRIFTAAVGLA